MFYFGKRKAGKLIIVESKSVDIASKNFGHISKGEYDTFMASLPTPPKPEIVIPIDTKKLKAILKAKGIIADESEIEVETSK